MKIAKPNEQDQEAALQLLGLLDTVSSGYFPSSGPDDMEAPLYFDEDDPAHLAQLWERLKACINLSPGFQGRVIHAAMALINPRNRLIDQASDTLDLHPRFAALPTLDELAVQHARASEPLRATRWMVGPDGAIVASEEHGAEQLVGRLEPRHAEIAGFLVAAHNAFRATAPQHSREGEAG